MSLTETQFKQLGGVALFESFDSMKALQDYYGKFDSGEASLASMMAHIGWNSCLATLAKQGFITGNRTETLEQVVQQKFGRLMEATACKLMIKRDHFPHQGRPYMVINFGIVDGKYSFHNGYYDLTLSEAAQYIEEAQAMDLRRQGR